MTTQGIPSKNIYNSVLKDTNFSKVHNVLRRSDVHKFIQMTSSERVLQSQLDNYFSQIQRGFASATGSHIKDKDEFYEFIANLFQSLTNIGYTTYEIVSFIVNAIKSESVLKINEEEILDFLSNSICIMHTDYYKFYTGKNERKILDSFMFGHGPKDYFNVGLVFGEDAKDMIQSSESQIYKKDIKILTSANGIKYKQFLSQTQNNKKKALKKGLENNFKNSSLNSNIINPSKTQTSVSSIILSNPKIRIGTQNNLELSTFFNAFTNIELNKSFPYLNATFILPKLARSNTSSSVLKTTLAKSSTVNNFLFGGEDKINDNYNNLAGDTVNYATGTVKSNMSLFTMPQTYVNLNENLGHEQNTDSKNRFTPVIDSTQPFMTIKSFNINASSTKGLMSYKSGKLSLVLHDRSRLNDIAPFVKPDLFGTFGAEIILEYGWSHINKKEEESPIGCFIDNSKVTEKYMIINSSFSIDNTGSVNIDLSIAMKGPYHFKNQVISTEIANRVTQSEFENAVGNLNYNRSLINKTKNYLENYSLNSNAYPNLFSETSLMSSNTNKYVNRFLVDNLFIQKTLKNNPGSISVLSNSSGKVTIKINKNQIFTEKNNSDKIKKLKTLLKLLSLQKNERQALSDLRNRNKSDIEITIKSQHSPSEVKSFIDQIIKTTSYIMDLFSLISFQDGLEEEARKTVLENIVGSLDLIDPFYPTDSQSYDKITNHKDYVSLGSIINTIVQAYIANVKGDKRSQFDEIQTIFYTCNSKAAGMAYKPISSFLVPKKMLSELLESIFSKKAIATPESIITQILTNLIHVHDNISLGLTDLYENRKSVKDPLKPKSTIIKNEWQAQKDSVLHSIYFPNQVFDPKNDVKFVTPIVHMNFDCLTSGNLNKERTILRISIFDRADSPFAASSSIMEKLYSGDINNALDNINKNRIDLINKRKGENGADQGNASAIAFKNERDKEINKLMNKGIVTYDQDSKLYKLNFEKMSESNTLNGKIKDAFKEIYPSLTLGSSNSAIISANVSSINDNKLSTIFITRPDRNNVSSINDRIQQTDLPLRVLPSQAAVEIFGCPWVNFGQSIFLDFNTGTSIDNKYVVTGISHNLTPGKFTTQLTLAYGDNYGQFESAANSLNEKVGGAEFVVRDFNKSVNASNNTDPTSNIIIINPETQVDNNELFTPNLTIINRSQ